MQAFEPLPGSVRRALRAAIQHPGELRPSWELAAQPSDRHGVLFVDGFLSDSGAGNIVSIHRKRLDTIDPDWRYLIRGFSYWNDTRARHSGETGYVGYDTLGSIRRQADRLSAFLASSPQGAQWSIVAYSMGAVVALLALSTLQQQSPAVGLVRDRVNQLVLVAPALWGAPHGQQLLTEILGASLGAELSQIEEESPLFAALDPFLATQLAVVVSELGHRESAVVKAARGSISELLRSGVSVSVLYATADTFTPFESLGQQRVLELDVDSIARSVARSDRARPQQMRHPFVFHLQVKAGLRNHAVIYQLVKPSLALFPRPDSSEA